MKDTFKDEKISVENKRILKQVNSSIHFKNNVSNTQLPILENEKNIQNQSVKNSNTPFYNTISKMKPDKILFIENINSEIENIKENKGINNNNSPINEDKTPTAKTTSFNSIHSNLNVRRNKRMQATIIPKKGNPELLNQLALKKKTQISTIKEQAEITKDMALNDPSDILSHFSIIELLQQGLRSELEIEEIYKYLSKNNTFFEKLASMYSQFNMAKEICAKMRYRFIPANTVFFKTGQRGESFYFIIDGTFALLASIPSPIEMYEWEFVDYLERLKAYGEDEVFERVKKDNPTLMKKSGYFDRWEDNGDKGRKKSMGKLHFDDTMNFEELKTVEGWSSQDVYIARIHPRGWDWFAQQKEKELAALNNIEVNKALELKDDKGNVNICINAEKIIGKVVETIKVISSKLSPEIISTPNSLKDIKSPNSLSSNLKIDKNEKLVKHSREGSNLSSVLNIMKETQEEGK